MFHLKPERNLYVVVLLCTTLKKEKKPLYVFIFYSPFPIRLFIFSFYYCMKVIVLYFSITTEVNVLTSSSQKEKKKYQVMSLFFFPMRDNFQFCLTCIRKVSLGIWSREKTDSVQIQAQIFSVMMEEEAERTVYTHFQKQGTWAAGKSMN